MNAHPSFVDAPPVDAPAADGRPATCPLEAPSVGASLGEASPSEWILIFATWFARSRPNLSAEDVLALAISEFKTSHSLPPEQAAARYRG